MLVRVLTNRQVFNLNYYISIMNHQEIFNHQRKSFIRLGEIYFWTATINSWKHLLIEDDYKNIILSSLQFLTLKGKVDVFSFVIMPNHIHLIWRVNELNGKETAQGSFLKFTAHEFKKKLKIESPEFLKEFSVVVSNKSFEFWQRDSLAVLLDSREKAYQKLNYIHNNPLAEHWQLVQDPSNYYYSSASFYERGEVNFDFLKDLRDEF